MDPVLMNSEKSKTSDPHRFKRYLKWCDKYVALSDLSIYYA